VTTSPTRTLPDCGIDWDSFLADYNRIRDKIEAVFPDLFADFNNRIRYPGGFHLTNPPRQRVWNTATGRANFLVFPGVDEDPPVSDPAMLRLATLRSHDQYNTTIYGLDDRYRGSVTLPNSARNKSPGPSGSRRSDDFVPCMHGRCPEGSVSSC
jgi:hypothetical protein